MNNIIQGDTYRITVLTNQLVRLEYNAKGYFEDRKTQTVVNREFPNVEYFKRETDEEIIIQTKNIKIIYDKKEFTDKGLSIQVLGNYSAYHSTWYYGQDFDDLKGTARTLDFIDGKTKLQRGLISKNGFSYFDDSNSLILLDNGFVESRSEKGIDLYFFGYGRDYYGCLKDFYHLCGKQPILPRYALGNWWSRFYRYSEQSYLELMDTFKEKEIPLSISVIDMDWHITDIDPKYGSGWTGYTWNKELFPDPKRFLNTLHDRKLKTTLNVHPAAGIRAFESQYQDMAKAMEVDIENEETVEFDFSNKKFIDSYFKYVNQPLEQDGVDFWWVDWQQEGHSKVEGLDPLWMLNHYHYHDNDSKQSRGLTFSRYAGIGSHRYPLGFSGDSIISWESLAFQPYFSATATNVGYGWWSHDIGGHMQGIKDDELQLRWLQSGVLSPINRLHSSCNEFCGKEPWKYPKHIELAMIDAMKLRHRLIPYIHSTNIHNYELGRCLIHPLYYKHPHEEDAYTYKNSYYFGENIIVNPVVTPMDSKSMLSKTAGWLPEGIWYDFFSDMVYTGKGRRNFYRDLNTLPMFVRAGSIIPLDANPDFGVDNPEVLELHVYAGQNGTYVLYEDDDTNDIATTTISLQWQSQPVLKIHKPVGNIKCIPTNRKYKIVLHGFSDTLHHNTIIPCTLDEDIEIMFASSDINFGNKIEKCFTILQAANIEYDYKSMLFDIIKNTNASKDGVNYILASNTIVDDIMLALIEVISG